MSRTAIVSSCLLGNLVICTTEFSRDTHDRDTQRFDVEIAFFSRPNADRTLNGLQLSTREPFRYLTAASTTNVFNLCGVYLYGWWRRGLMCHLGRYQHVVHHMSLELWGQFIVRHMGCFQETLPSRHPSNELHVRH